MARYKPYNLQQAKMIPQRARIHPDPPLRKDREVPMLARMFEMRLRGYRAIGYEQRELPVGYEGGPDEPVIEWDEGALRTFKDPI